MIVVGIFVFNAAIYGFILLIAHLLGPPVRPLQPSDPPRSP